jgi:hypothetical protein
MVYFLIFGIVNSAEEVNPYCLPVVVFDELLTSHRLCIEV